MMLDGFFMKFRYRYVERLWGYGFDGPVWRRQFGESYFCNVSFADVAQARTGLACTVTGVPSWHQ